jgi:uncharacterized protein YbjT (DUF2867 family)
VSEASPDPGRPTLILVTGATGTVGGHVLRALTAEGAAVRALVRSEERADALRGFDVEVAVGTYEDADAMGRALDGVERVFLVAPTGPDMAEQELCVVRAVAAAGTRPHVVKVAAAGVDAPGEPWTRVLREHRRVVSALTEAGLPTTVLAPSVFFQNLLRFPALLQEKGCISAPVGDTPLTWADARDVAAVAAHVLTTDAHDGATYTVTGPEQISYPDLAQRLGAFLGREVEHQDTDPDAARQVLLDTGSPEWNADAQLEVYAGYRDGRGPDVTEEVLKATGRPPRSLEDFLADHRAVFR